MRTQGLDRQGLTVFDYENEHTNKILVTKLVIAYFLKLRSNNAWNLNNVRL